MLAYALAIAVAISSLALFTTAFFMSDIHRQDDFLWSGVGLFYASILWFCARNITGAVLLGQAAATTLLVSYSWQTLKLRKAVANPEKAAEINNFSVLRSVNNFLRRGKDKPQLATVTNPNVTSNKVTEEVAMPNTTSKQKTSSANGQKSGGLGRFFRKSKSTITNTKLDEILEEPTVTKSENPATPATPIAQPANNPEPKQPLPKTVPTKPATAPAPVARSPQPQVNFDEVARSETSSVETKPAAKSTEVEHSTKQAEIETPTETASVVELSTPETAEAEQSQPSAVTPAENSSNVVTAENPLVENKPESEIRVEAAPDAEDKQTEIDSAVNSAAPQVDPPQLTDESIETKESPGEQKIPPVNALDSLETVEVAEVLEAANDDNYRDRDDKTNVIEVTTTEINITREVTKIDLEDENSTENAEDLDK